MKLTEEIIKEAEKANRDDDLPDTLLEEIRSICSNNKLVTEKEHLFYELLERLENYEPFADVGCGNESYSTADVQRTVEKVGEKPA